MQTVRREQIDVSLEPTIPGPEASTRDLRLDGRK
jgi:hypothetical protein